MSGGVSTVQAALRANLIDEFHLHLVPVLLGSGTRLFDQIASEQIELERWSRPRTSRTSASAS